MKKLSMFEQSNAESAPAAPKRPASEKMIEEFVLRIGTRDVIVFSAEQDKEEIVLQMCIERK